ncbi:MAG: hypothetical protein H6862_04760 [Rhodospirillales bacterium]|nr:hypothetical protein [Rhodospirillales bacterium]
MPGETSDSGPLGDASLIIDRFGGIRPMSNKIGVPVTTIQGWKKRGMIPAARREKVLDAAKENGIDLSDVLSGNPPPNENAESMPITIEGKLPDSPRAWHGVKDSVESLDNSSDDVFREDPDDYSDDEDGEESSDFLSSDDPEDDDADSENTLEKEGGGQNDEEIPLVAPSGTSGFERYRRSAISRDPPVSVMKDKPYGDGELSDLIDKIKTVEVRGGRHMTFIATTLVAAALAFTAVLFWPESPSVVVSASSSPEKEMRQGDRYFPKFSSGLSEGIHHLDEGVRSVKESVESVAAQTQKAISTLSDPDAGSLGDRIGALQGQVKAMGAPTSLSTFLSRIEGMTRNIEGQETLRSALSGIRGIVAGLGGQTESVDSALEQGREQNPALAETFSGVAPEDLKAAALLVVFSQFRDTLDRGNTPFDKDLSLLLDLVGEDNAPLRESLLRLAPQAEKGILTPSGLSSQFRQMAGEAVVSSLQGEDVPFEERAIARLNEVLRVEKNGELITGTDTQAKIARARTALDSGDIEEAVAELEGLEGPAAEAARPWIDQAQAVLVAGEIKQMVSGLLTSHLHQGGPAKYTARSKGFSGLIPQAPVIHDPESGVLLLPKGTSLPDGPDMPEGSDLNASP